MRYTDAEMLYAMKWYSERGLDWSIVICFYVWANLGKPDIRWTLR